MYELCAGLVKRAKPIIKRIQCKLNIFPLYTYIGVLCKYKL